MHVSPNVIVRDDRINIPIPNEDYVNPDISADAEIASCMFHVERCNFTEEPKHLKEKVLNTVEELYKHARWEQPEDWDSPRRIEDMIDNLNMKAGCGYPYCLDAATNADYIKKFGKEHIIRTVQARLADLKKGIPSADPVRIFIKREPHDKSKADLKRWRMIWNVSVIDQIIDALLWQANIDKEIAKHSKIPSKPGWTPLKGGMNQLFNEMLGAPGTIYASADKSSWDFTVPGWMLLWDMELRFRLCNNFSENASWVTVAKTRYTALYCGQIIFSNGWLYQQLVPCILRSGSKVTISTNSKCQVILKVLSLTSLNVEFEEEKDKMGTMGDDSLERLSIAAADYKAAMESFGFIVKYVDTNSDLTKMHFCSETFKRTPYGTVVSVPTSYEKNAYNLIHKEESKMDLDILIQTLDSYCQRYAWDDEHFPLFYGELKRLVAKYPQHAHFMHSHAWYKSLVAGFESSSE